MAAPFVGVEQDLVGQHVELLLRLALHVVAARFAEHAAQAALADGNGNGLAGTGDDLDQELEIAGDGALCALFFGQIASQRALCHGNSCGVVEKTRFYPASWRACRKAKAVPLFIGLLSR